LEASENCLLRHLAHCAVKLFSNHAMTISSDRNEALSSAQSNRVILSRLSLFERQSPMASNMDFRGRARDALKRAEAELATQLPERLPYAALELRYAMEAVTYDKASAYQDELPPSEYATWQPRKLMQALLEIDPDADQGVVLSAGIEKEYGQAAEQMTVLGKAKVLTLAEIKKYYDALSQHLHIPTFRQLESGTQPDLTKLRSRCEQSAAALRGVLQSSLWNVRFGNKTEAACLRCKSSMNRILPLGDAPRETVCKCGARYRIESAEAGLARWIPIKDQYECPACNVSFRLWTDEFVPGTWMTCQVCKETLVVALGICVAPPVLEKALADEHPDSAVVIGA
jgi:hypothetical protein